MQSFNELIDDEDDSSSTIISSISGGTHDDICSCSDNNLSYKDNDTYDYSTADFLLGNFFQCNATSYPQLSALLQQTTQCTVTFFAESIEALGGGFGLDDIPTTCKKEERDDDDSSRSLFVSPFSEMHPQEMEHKNTTNEDGREGTENVKEGVVLQLGHREIHDIATDENKEVNKTDVVETTMNMEDKDARDGHQDIETLLLKTTEEEEEEEDEEEATSKQGANPDSATKSKELRDNKEANNFTEKDKKKPAAKQKGGWFFSTRGNKRNNNKKESAPEQGLFHSYLPDLTKGGINQIQSTNLFGNEAPKKRKVWQWGGGKKKASTKKESQLSTFFTALISESESKTEESNNSTNKNDTIGNFLNTWIRREDEDEDASEDTKNDVSKGKSIADLKRLVDIYGSEVKRVGAQYFGDIEVKNLSPASFFYYLEREEEVKNPSWKCRKHRFHQNLKTNDVSALNAYFHYADLAYLEQQDKIKEDLSNPNHYDGATYDPIFAKEESMPHDPAFYVATKRGSRNPCEILLAIRGTASIEDVITDSLCDKVEYRGGQAHSGILQSGQNIAKQFKSILDGYVQHNRVKKPIEVLIVGHSLGGGSACIVGLELQGNKNLNVRVLGFGTPGILSKEIGEEATFITTVVCDCDAIPRTSGETVVNLVLDIMEYDWTDKARLDADLMIQNFQKKNTWIMSDFMREKALKRIDILLENQIMPSIREKSTKRLEPILFPPGNCIHLWRNGSGVSGSLVPGSFFNQIDVSRTMIDDHLCDQGYRSIFLQLMRQHNEDPHFRFETKQSQRTRVRTRSHAAGIWFPFKAAE